MKAIAIKPGKGEPKLIDINEPEIKTKTQVKLETLQVGICGTDREEADGGRADPPPGNDYLIIGHEMFGRVVETGNDVTFVKPGDLATFTVRRGCGMCTPCLNNRSDMCFTGKYTERGIKELHGFQAEFIVDDVEYLIKIPDEIKDIAVLTEPLSIVEKALHEAVNLQSARLPGIEENWIKGKKVLVAGLGSVGLLAAFLLNLYETKMYGLDIVDENSLRPSLFKKLGGRYINGKEIKTRDIDEIYGEMDFIFEATGAAKLEFQLIDALSVNGIYVFTGIPGDTEPIQIAGGTLMKQMVLKNQLLLGSVNAGYMHYVYAVKDLMKIFENNSDLISPMITYKIPFENFQKAFTSRSLWDIKTVIEWK